MEVRRHDTNTRQPSSGTPKARTMNRATFGAPVDVMPFGYSIRWTRNDPACPHLVALDRDGVVIDFLGAAARDIYTQVKFGEWATVTRFQGRKKAQVAQ